MLKIDEFEPTLIEHLLLQSLPDTIRVQLNRLGYADYSWETYSNETEHVERKQCSEILGGKDKIEAQLRKEISTCANLSLIVEGVAEPILDGTRVYNIENNRWKFRDFGLPFRVYEATLVAFERAGVPVWKTTSSIGTAHYLVQRYNSAQKADHQTFKRYITPKFPEFKEQPQIAALLGLAAGYPKIKIGPKTAENLIDAFGTVWDILIAPPEVIADIVEGVSEKRIIDFQRTVGRQI